MKKVSKFSNLIRIISVVLFFNSILSFFLFFVGSYNFFLNSFQQFSLNLSIVLSFLSFSIEGTRLFFFNLLRGKKIGYFKVLLVSFIIASISLFIKVMLS